MNRARSFLFLQGVCSPFFAKLADRLTQRGHRVSKINFNVGDCVYWGMRPACRFRGHINELRDFLENIYRKQGITDQILFGDRRPVHRPAVEAGKELGLRTHVFEEGYFRPFWVTLERDGVNRHSLMPRDPKWFYDVGGCLGDFGSGRPFRSTFGIRAFHDVAYHCAGLWNPVLFPNYRTHAPCNAATEYLNYSKRLPLLRLQGGRASKVIAEFVQNSTPYYFLPLQLGSDAQIRDHSSFEGMTDVLELVMQSFAKHASKETHLVIKNHPLDTGQINYARKIFELSGQFGLEGRVDYLEVGDLHALLENAKGTVTVNSTVGAISMGLNCPTIALGEAIYNLPGLTFQGSLDEFWTAPQAPDMELFRRFRNTVIHSTQINGGFYSKEGIALAVENAIPRLERDCSPLEELL